MTGLKAILAAMALAGILSTSLGDAQRAEKLRPRASSTCCATEVSKQSIHSDANRLGLVIGNSSYPDADVPPTQIVNDASALASSLRNDGFDIYLVQNATRDDMTRAIAHLKTKVRPDSIVMVYLRLRYSVRRTKLYDSGRCEDLVRR
jgi:hypothetical protein